MIHLRPITVKDASRFVARHHRHNDAPVGAMWAIACCRDGDDEPCGVAIVGRPKARKLQDGWTCEVTQLGTDGVRNGCSMLYGAAARAAKAMGYRRITTLLLATEPGSSIKAAGWTKDHEIDAMPTWSRPSRNRIQADLFGDRRPSGAKVRWSRYLSTCPLSI